MNSPFSSVCVCVVCVQDEQRLKCLCVGATPVSYAQETKRRLEDIRAMLA